MFSGRLPPVEGQNRLHKYLQLKRSRGEIVLDLTSSNPTEEGLIIENSRLQHFFYDKRNVYYKPTARGLLEAREAIARYYLNTYNLLINPDDIFLTTGTSESYSYLFKLLVNPGERVLIPSPVYPLFEFIAKMEGIETGRYMLCWRKDKWFYNFNSFLDHRNVRTIIIINPNNPTGSYISSDEKSQLLSFSREKNIPLIIDEVFYEYNLDCSQRENFVSEKSGLNFVLNGISKLCGLPQMKLGWIILSGEQKLKAEAGSRLEIISDTFLSVSTPIMRATEKFLEQGNFIRQKIQERIKCNYNYLKSRMQAPYRMLPTQGGWYVIIELDEKSEDEEFALILLREKNVYVYPGYFFEFEEENKIVISLIVKEEMFQEGVERIMSL